MLQMAKNKYSVETLRELNVSYDHEHGLTQKDVDMANSYVELIEQTRFATHLRNSLNILKKYQKDMALRSKPNLSQNRV
jgi:hypothetical protein